LSMCRRAVVGPSVCVRAQRQAQRGSQRGGVARAAHLVFLSQKASGKLCAGSIDLARCLHTHRPGACARRVCMCVAMCVYVRVRQVIHTSRYSAQYSMPREGGASPLVWADHRGMSLCVCHEPFRVLLRLCSCPHSSALLAIAFPLFRGK
jgi:hypothetical protein